MFNFVLNLVFQFSLVICGNKYSYEKQSSISLSICVVILALIPFSVIFLEGVVGFIVTGLLIMLQGFANSIFQSSMYGLCGFLPLKFIIGMSMGNGFAGLGMNVIRYMILFIYGNDTSRGTIVTGSLWFFGIAVFILIVGLLLMPMLYKNSYFQVHFHKSGEVGDEEYKQALTEFDFSEEQYLPEYSDEVIVSNHINYKFREKKQM